uniref:Uncharacterized protein n=1 Tax=Candidozyma auris TaxID=498019 RepID=A0A0L0NMP1_CANAR
MQGPFGSCNWNEYNVNTLTRNNWRASLVPAAAVIPAPRAYIKVVAVKKLVVEPWVLEGGPPHGEYFHIQDLSSASSQEAAEYYFE